MDSVRCTNRLRNRIARYLEIGLYGIVTIAGVVFAGLAAVSALIGLLEKSPILTGVIVAGGVAGALVGKAAQD